MLVAQTHGPHQEGEFKHRVKYHSYCPVLVEGTETLALLDSGNSAGNVMSGSFAKKIGLRQRDLEEVHQTYVSTAQKGAKMRVLGRPRQKLHLRFAGSNTRYAIKPLIIDGLSMDLNLSGPFMSKHGFDQLHSKQKLRVQGKEIPLFTYHGDRDENIFALSEPWESGVYVNQDTEIPAQSVALLPLKVPDVSRRLAGAGPGLLQASDQFETKTDLHPVVCALTHTNEDGKVLAAVMNTLDKPITVKEDVRYGTMYRMTHTDDDSENVVASVQNSEDQTDKKEEIKNRDWFIEKFKLKDSPFLKEEKDLNKAVNLLLKYADIFSENDEYGKTDLVQHAIHTEDIPPIKCKNRPINPTLEPLLREQVNHWLKHEVIEPSQSPWSFPLLAVAKKNGKTRWVCDFRRLNQVTHKDSFPIPSIADNLSRLAHSKVFSGIDGTGAFHVVSIRPEDREKTAFSTPWGLYQFKQMPFGLCNAPATYCRLVQKVLEGIPLSVALPYLDDTCIHSVDLDKHVEGLELVLEAHRRSGLTLQPAKCQLFQPSIEYLGHEVSDKGISVPAKYIKIIQEWPTPQNVHDVRVFLGKASYYRRFILNFSQRSAALSDLTAEETEKEFEWTAKAEESFQDLKAALLQAPILAYPRFDSDEPFIVDTDWSQDPGAIGAVLSQKQDGEERVIAYGARKLGKAEKNYSSNKGEMLAVIFFLRYWRYYLSHRPFLLRTDHEALKWIKTMEEPKGMIARWLDTLANFDFTIEFRRGKKHGNADALSRTSHAELLEPEEEPEVAALEPVVFGRDSEQLKKAQQEDEELQEVRKWILEDKWPSSQEARALSQSLRAYASLNGQIQEDEHGILVRTQSDNFKLRTKRPCVPLSMQEELARRCHEESGHRGIVNTHEQINKRFFFPGSTKEATMAVNLCPICQKNQPNPSAQHHTLASSPSGYPWQRISIDFVGPLPVSDQGNSYILTIKDYFSRWVEAKPTSNMTAVTVARVLENEIFCRYGFPEAVHSDQGTQFTSGFMQDLYKELGIKSTHTPSYNPKSNVVERAHRDLGKLLRACVDESPQDWESYLPACLLAMRTARCESTGFSPHFLLFGRDCNLPIDLAYGNPPGEKMNTREYAQQVRERIRVAFQQAREKQKMSIERSRRYYNNQLQGSPLAIGDKVWLFTPKTTARSRKLQSRWTGPWEIIRVISPVLFRVRCGPWNRNVVEIDASIDRLRRFTVRDEPLNEQENIQNQDVDTHDEYVELGEESSGEIPEKRATTLAEEREKEEENDVSFPTGGFVRRHAITPTDAKSDREKREEENATQERKEENVVPMNNPTILVEDWGRDWDFSREEDEEMIDVQPSQHFQEQRDMSGFQGWRTPRRERESDDDESMVNPDDSTDFGSPQRRRGEEEKWPESGSLSLMDPEARAKSLGITRLPIPREIQGIKEDLMPAIQEEDQPMDVHFPSPSAPPAIEEAEDGADMNEDAAAAAATPENSPLHRGPRVSLPPSPAGGTQDDSRRIGNEQSDKVDNFPSDGETGEQPMAIGYKSPERPSSGSQPALAPPRQHPALAPPTTVEGRPLDPNRLAIVRYPSGTVVLNPETLRMDGQLVVPPSPVQTRQQQRRQQQQQQPPQHRQQGGVARARSFLRPIVQAFNNPEPIRDFRRPTDPHTGALVPVRGHQRTFQNRTPSPPAISRFGRPPPTQRPRPE